MMIVMEVDMHFMDETFICDVLRQGTQDHSLMMTIVIIHCTMYDFYVEMV